MAISTNQTISKVTYNGVEIPLAGSGGGGGAGFSVTFPATAANWDMMGENGCLILADGTTKSIKDYSAISGQTIKNVVGIEGRSASTSDFYVLKMVLSEGAIAQRYVGGVYISHYVTTSPNATKTLYNSGQNMFWWPIADTVISSIEMYNTD